MSEESEQYLYTWRQDKRALKPMIIFRAISLLLAWLAAVAANRWLGGSKDELFFGAVYSLAYWLLLIIVAFLLFWLVNGIIQFFSRSWRVNADGVIEVISHLDKTKLVFACSQVMHITMRRQSKRGVQWDYGSIVVYTRDAGIRKLPNVHGPECCIQNLRALVKKAQH